MKLPTKLPKRFWPYFWDVNPAKVNPTAKPAFVVQRLLDKGNADCVQWVCKNFPKETISYTFKTMRDFRPQIGNFWRLVLDLPQGQVACLQPSYLKMRLSHWPF